MQHRSGKSEQHLIGPARRRALETYLRFGRTPDGGPGQSEGKAVNQTAATPHAAPVRATRFYVWRTAGDDRVRAGHVQRDGKVFSWSELPAGGHPGSQHNCRCWPEPYYGDPSVPDALQPLHYVQQSDTAGNQLWASIETLTRPDGSLAQSVVVANDGTRFQTSFRATTVNRVVTLPNGQIVRVDTDSGLQSVYLGADSTPLFQSRWTANGPKVVRARQHVAFLLDGDQSNDLGRRPGMELTGGGGGGGAGFGLGAVAVALTALQGIFNAAPASQGLGQGDRPVLAISAWTIDGKSLPVAILVGSLTEEQLRQDCRFLPDVQNWTNEAAAALAEQKPILPARTWGSLVHGVIKRTIDALKTSIPFIYDKLHPEISFSPDTTGEVTYGLKGSTRLDVVEDRSDLGVVCDYDVKTGREGLTLKRLKEIAERLSERYPGATIYIIQVRPET